MLTEWATSNGLPETGTEWVFLPPIEINSDIDAYNDAVMSQLYAYQEKHKEFCFYVGFLALRRKYYPDEPLPQPETYIEEVQRAFGHLNYDGSLMVDELQTGQALAEFLPTLGLEFTGYALTEIGEEKIGEGMKPWGEPLYNTHDRDPLPSEFITPPCGILLHQTMSSTSHFLAEDLTQQVEAMKKVYASSDPAYNPIAVFYVRKIT